MQAFSIETAELAAKCVIANMVLFKASLNDSKNTIFIEVSWNAHTYQIILRIKFLKGTVYS